MQKIYLALIVALLIPFLSVSQAPGYLGKKAIISLSTSAIPTFNGPTQNNRGLNPYYEGNGDYGINYEFVGSLEYVVGRYRSVSLLLSQYYTGDELNIETRARPVGPFDDFGIDRHELFLRLNVRSVGFIISRYKKGKGGLAPVGNRFYWGLKRSYVSSSIVDKRTNYHSVFGPTIGHNNLETGDKYTQNYILFGWSNNQIFWDRLVLKTGVRFAFALSYNAYDYSEESSSDDTNRDLYKRSVGTRLGLHEMMRFDVGLGYLLF